MHQQVVIAGGGPVGLITALGLAKQGVDVVVLERHPHVIQEPRAMTYHWAVLDGLAKLGILQDMETEGFRLHEMCYRVYHTGEIIKLDISAVDDITAYPYAVVLGQDQISSIVLRHLENYPNAQIRWNTEVQRVEDHGDKAVVHVSTPNGNEQLTGDWIIGADGAKSRTRQAAGVELEGFTWPEQFVATNIQCDLEAFGWDDCNYLVDPEYGAVIAKITRDGLWRVTFSEPAGSTEQDLEDRIWDYYRQVFPNINDIELKLYSSYQMHQRVASSMRVGRILLAGDAAHLTNPTNGFGLVSGMMDALTLSQTLSAVIHGKASDEILDQYSDERRRVFNEVATPSSTETKRLVFHSEDSDRLEKDLQRLRNLTRSRKERAKQLSIGQQLLTPGLDQLVQQP